MEVLVGDLNRKGETLDTSTSLRLAVRPVDARGQIAKGRAYEDFGSSLTSKSGSSSQQSRSSQHQGAKLTRATGKHSASQLLDLEDSQSEDEIDMIKGKSGSAGRGASDSLSKDAKQRQKDADEVENRNAHSTTDSVLKRLKFTKKKSGDTPSEPSTSQTLISKENGGAHAAADKQDSIIPQRIQRAASQTYSGSLSKRDEDQNNAPAALSRSLSNVQPPRRTSPPRKSKPPQDRPKPRPIGQARSQLNFEPLPMSKTASQGDCVSTPQTKTSRTRAAKPFPMFDSPPVQDPKKTTIKKPMLRTVKKPKIADFPVSSSSSTPPQKKKTTTVKKPIYLTMSSASASPQTEGHDFPQLEPLGTPKAIPRSAVSSFPMQSPLSSPAHANVRGKAKARIKPKEKLKPGKVVYSDDEGMEGDDTQNSVLKPQPFPMNTQLSGMVDPPQAGPSKTIKRTSENGSGSEREKKKRKDDGGVIVPRETYTFDEDEETLFILPSTDPNTLCPYCDSPLPSSPSPLLRKLLDATAKKSYKDSRPANPLGRRAPLGVFISVCQRHRFESQILPEAELKGWPKHIEWTELGKRIEKMRIELEALINDRGSDHYMDIADDVVLVLEKEPGPRSKCVFWKEVVTEVKTKGSRAAAGVRGQFANFEKTQPGYYGELGSVIIHQTLYNLFPPDSFDSTSIAPLSANEFVQRILVPEVGVRLIMEDKSLTGESGVEMAVQILRDSASYGVAMFPEDGGEWDDKDGQSLTGKADDDEMGVADLMVMERARKRRRELEVEEEQEEEAIKLSELAVGNEKGKATRKDKVKAKAKQTGVEVESVENKEPPPRPRPKPIMKTSSTASVLSNETNPGLRRSRRHATDTEDEGMTGQRSGLEPATTNLSKRSPSLSDMGVDGAYRPRKTRAAKKSAGNGVSDMEVSTDIATSDDDGSRNASVTTKPRKKGRTRASSKAASVNTEPDEVEFVESQVTPVANRHRRIDVGDKDDNTPRPAPIAHKQPSASSLTDGTRKPAAFPLLIARQRERDSSLEKQDSQNTDEIPTSPLVTDLFDNIASRTKTLRNQNGDSWLLSDSSGSQSSMASREH